MRRPLRSLFVVALLVGLAGCRTKTAAAAPHHALSASADELRRTFNEDAGKVRIVMLVSPT